MIYEIIKFILAGKYNLVYDFFRGEGISALIVFNVESDTFGNFFDAIYWATVSLTTVRYGDIYPVLTAGRIITMLSSLFDIVTIALPAGIITAGYMDKMNMRNEK